MPAGIAGASNRHGKANENYRSNLAWLRVGLVSRLRCVPKPSVTGARTSRRILVTAAGALTAWVLVGGIAFGDDLAIKGRFPGYMAWIAKKTGWFEPAPPKVVLTPEARMAEMAFGPSGESMGLRPRAAYSRMDHSVHLSTNFNSSDLLDQSIVVHELVHHMQDANHIEFACPANREAQAYRLQADWLREHGASDALALMHASQLSIDALDECP